MENFDHRSILVDSGTIVHWNAFDIHAGELVLLAGSEGEQDIVGGGQRALPRVVVHSPLRGTQQP